MSNVYTRENNATPKPNRNTFPMGYTNNLSLKMGQITPFYIQDVIPGDSWRAKDVSFGFNSFPMVFPVQSDIVANVHFFYVRNRALWDGWQDFITKQKNRDGDNIKPYLLFNDANREMLNTGNICDFLGVPTVTYQSTSYDINYPFYNYADLANKLNYYYSHVGRTLKMEIPSDSMPETSKEIYLNLIQDVISRYEDGVPATNTTGIFKYNASKNNPYPVTPTYYGILPNGCQSITFPVDTFFGQLYKGQLAQQNQNTSITLNIVIFTKEGHVIDVFAKTLQTNSSVSIFETSSSWDYSESSSGVNLLEYNNGSILSGLRYSVFLSQFVSGNIDLTERLPIVAIDNATIAPLYPIPNKDRSLYDLPFASSYKSDGIHVDAMPYRAVEACYNAFYRDERNNPLLIDGEPQYNVWVENTKGGADTSLYKLYQRNWEQDMFTTAVQSPQQGVAPLVGVTATGEMTFQDDEGKTYYLQAEFGEDGHTISGIKSYSSDMPVGTLRAMVDTISTGISINDFRNVNALQRWLETNMRKGYRYKDVIEAHFGTSPTYSELNMPQFIGGMSRNVNVNKIVQTSIGTDAQPLGSLGGNANILGKSVHDITHYCDEHGWIIGFITLSPKPVYSQIFNKMFHRTELLDYYFPEFAHIGYQPILNQELTPLQCDDTEGNRLSDVFGYQRAWYEYLSRVDEVHGDFRETLRDYLINRTFDGVPHLSRDFLTISPSEANEIFVDTSDNAKFFGQIIVDVVMKRPLPTVAIPKLE